MRFFIQKSVSSFQQNGKKKTSFKIMKGTEDNIHQIRGISSDNNPNIYTIIENKSHKNNGKIITKHKQFKIKASNIQKLLKESSNSKTKNPELKTITLKPSTKAVKKNIKIDVKKIDKTLVKKTPNGKKPVILSNKTENKKKAETKKVNKVKKSVVSTENNKKNETKKVAKKILKDNVSITKNTLKTNKTSATKKQTKTSKKSKSNLKLNNKESK